MRKEVIKIDIKLCPTATTDLPEYATEGSAGFDLTIDTSKETVLEPNASQVFPAGIKVEIPKGYVGLVFPRSGLGTKGIVLTNTVGVIDSDYRGEIHLPLKNTSNEPYTFKPKERVAQMIIMPYTKVAFNIVCEEDLGNTERGNNGFGSTGK